MGASADAGGPTKSAWPSPLVFFAIQKEMSGQSYVDGVAVRANPKQPTWTPKRSGWDKAGDVAYGTGYVVGMANTLREGYQTLRPLAEGLRMVA